MIVFHGVGGLNLHEHHKVFAGRHVMVSFATAPRRLPAFATTAASVALDNGAFSVWKQGGVLDVPGYIAWVDNALETLPNIAWACVPDVIDGDEAANDALLYDWPQALKPWAMPVWHLHESNDRLRRLSEDFSRVALGSSGDFADVGTRAWWQRLADAWPHIAPRAGVHGLRMVDPEITTRIPFASVDSTTAGRHGGMASKFGVPLNGCRRYTRVLAYAEYLEGVMPAMAFSVEPAPAQLEFWR